MKKPLIEIDKQLWTDSLIYNCVNITLVITSYSTVYSLDCERARYVVTPSALGEAISRTPEPRVILNFSKIGLAKPTSLIVDIPRRGTVGRDAYQWT